MSQSGKGQDRGPIKSPRSIAKKAAEGSGSSHLVLPGDGHTACGHFAVEGVIFGLKLHPFHRGELLDVQDVLTVDGLRLEVQKEQKVQSRNRSITTEERILLDP